MSEKTTWWKRFTSGLKRSSSALGEKVKQVLWHRKINDETLDEIEALLIQSDMGVETSALIRTELSKHKFEDETDTSKVLQLLVEILTRELTPAEKSFSLKPDCLNIILMVGVNGSGKTTTAAKLSQRFKQDGHSVAFAACDTFRAAASEQLSIWAQRVGIPLYAGETGKDPSSVAFDAVIQATQNKTSVLIVDTAGRLQNKTHLMQELQKVYRTLKKANPDAFIQTLLVLDAVIGQNALSQCAVFSESIPIDGLVLTKLDGTAKGGLAVALVKKFQLPIFAITLGENVEDLYPFIAKDFAKAILEITEE